MLITILIFIVYQIQASFSASVVLDSTTPNFELNDFPPLVAANDYISNQHFNGVDRITRLPIELLDVALDYLNPDLVPFSETCKYSKAACRRYTENKLSFFNPRLLTQDSAFNFALGCSALRTLNERASVLQSRNFFTKDVLVMLASLSFFNYSHFSKIAANFLLSKFGLPLLPSSLHQWKTTMERTVFSEGLFYAAEMLMKLSSTFASDYMNSVAAHSAEPIRSAFRNRIFQFPQVFSYLIIMDVIPSDYFMHYWNDPSRTQESKLFLLRKFSQSIYRIQQVNSEVVAAVISDMVALQIALPLCFEHSKFEWFTAILFASTEEQITALGEPWSGIRFLLSADEFDIERFYSIFTPNINYLKLFPSMSSQDPLHHQIFEALVVDGRIAVDTIVGIENNMFFICANSRVPEYWTTFVSRTAKFPPFWHDKFFLFSRIDMTDSMFAELLPNLASISPAYLVFFDSYSQWQRIGPIFTSLPLQRRVRVNIFLFISNISGLSMIPTGLFQLYDWPLLHLSIILGNINAFNAILAHHEFEPSMLEDTVGGYTVQNLIESMEIDFADDPPPFHFDSVFLFRSALQRAGY